MESYFENIDMQGYITLIFSFVITFSTVIYVILTAKLVKQTKLSREFFLESHISSYLVNSETQPGLISLVIKNIGKGVARDINFEIIKDIDYSNAANTLGTISIMKNGISYFPPGQKFKFILFDATDDIDKWQDEISFVVKYSDAIKRNRLAKYELKFKDLANFGKMTPSDTYIGQIAEELKKIRLSKEKTK
jgi:hypothetical protein